MLSDDFEKWLTDNGVAERYKRHAEKVAAPLDREEAHWADLLEDYSDAYAFAQSLRAEADDFEIQAMAAATVDRTIAQASGVCAVYLRWNRALKRLAESADRRTSVLQTLLRQGQ